jgi:hypothetical protein
MLLAKHNDILERGHDPGVGHLKKRKLHGNKGQNGQNGQNGGGTQNNGAAATAAAPGAEFTGVSLSKNPTVSPAVALDEDGDDICTSTISYLTCSLLLNSSDGDSRQKFHACNGQRVV